MPSSLAHFEAVTAATRAAAFSIVSFVRRSTFLVLNSVDASLTYENLRTRDPDTITQAVEQQGWLAGWGIVLLF
eukprot:scaffold234798_cov43-Prasinocladus_malaysianus.AAC.2